MKKVLISSCGIAAATLGAIALSAEPWKISETAIDGVVRVAQAAPSADQAAPPAGQAAPPAPDPGKPSAFDDPEDPDYPGDDADRPVELDDNRPGAPDDGEDAN
jgi:hypothetical protein